MRLFENTVQKKRAITVFLVIAAAVTYTLALKNVFPIIRSLRKFLLLFTPFYIGLTLAYLLNPILKAFEKNVFKKLRHTKLKRILSVVIVYIILIAFLTAVCAFVLPSLVSNIVNLVSNFQSYYDMFTGTVDSMLEKHPMINEYFEKYSDNLSGALYNIVTSLTTYISNSIPRIVKFTGQVSGTIVNIFLGFIISVYFLTYKERIGARCKRLLSAIFKDDTTNKIIKIAEITDVKTGKFIIGRIIDSIIMTVLCFILMTLFRFPYALLNSFIIGVFNLVPVFGSIVSAIPTAFIVLITKPSAFIYYLIFIIIIQQFDGNVLGPKIQGDQLGISALWIMFAVLLFGGLFGVIGMIVGVPIFAVIYYFVDEAIEMKLIKRKKPTNTEDYIK